MSSSGEAETQNHETFAQQIERAENKCPLYLMNIWCREGGHIC